MLGILDLCNNVNAQYIDRRIIQQETQKYFNVGENEIREAEKKITEIIKSEEFKKHVIEPILGGAGGAVPGIVMKNKMHLVEDYKEHFRVVRVHAMTFLNSCLLMSIAS